MKKLFVSILTLSTLMAATSCRPKQQQKENVIPVTVMEVQDVQSSYTRSYIGTVVSKHSTILLAPAEGTVVKIPVRQGQQVSKNTLIVKVDSPMAKGMKKTADASLSQARDGYARAEKVYKAGGMSEIQWKEVCTKLAQAESAQEMSESLVDDCDVSAPWDATVSDLYVTMGDNVRPLTRLAMLIDEKHLEISIGVPENEFSRIQEGMKAQVVIPAMDYYTAEAVIDDIGVLASQISHSYNVRLVFQKNPDGLKAGMACKVNLETDRENRVVVPASVVKVDDNGRYVWVVNDEDRVEKRAVKAGSFAGTGVSIESGISRGDRIIVEGTQKVSTGMKVQAKVVENL